MKKKYIIVLILLILLSVLFLYNIFTSSYMNEYEISFSYLIKMIYNEIKSIFSSSTYGNNITSTKIDSGITKKYKYFGITPSKRKYLPFTASCVLDIGKNNNELIFVGMGEGEDDLLLEYENGKFVNKIHNFGISSKTETSMAAASFDINNNGFTDILVARPSGLYLYINKNNKIFTQKKIYGPFIDSEPAAISIGDYNKDGLPDIYISMFTPANKLKAYQFNNPSHYRKNILLKNMGNLIFEDVTDETHSWGSQNTFTAIFIDNGTGYPDLLLSNDTGKPELLINNKGVFKSKLLDVPHGFWMGIAVGDYDNNGTQDVFLTNVGNTLPMSDKGGIRGNPRRGGLKENQKITNQHIFLKNNGEHDFKDIAQQVNAGDYGFGWGCIMEDIDLDGKIDLIFAQNYIDYPHPKMLDSVVLINDGQNFIRASGLQNPHYGQTPLFADIIGNGKKELIWINMHGPIFGYLIKSTNNYVSVKLPENTEFLNSTITLFQNDGKTQTRQNIVGGVGFGGDQSHLIMFGIGKEKTVSKIQIKTIYGKIYNITNPIINNINKLK